MPLKNSIFGDFSRLALTSPKKCYNGGYFEAARRWQNRSILFVCEVLRSKADAERAPLEYFF